MSDDRRAKEPRRLSDKTVDRRTLLEWLGKATVLTLGADLIAACSTTPSSNRDGSPPLDLQQLIDGNVTNRDHFTGDAATDTGDLSPASFPFQPGEGDSHKVFGGWGERTVDPQDLTSVLASWKLIIDGMVTSPKMLSFADLLQLTRQDQVTDFHCVEGWSIYDVPWNGVRLATLLELVDPLPAATHVTLHTIGNKYNESLPLSVANEVRTLAAYGIAGATLPLKHGFPLRVVVPRLLGYKNPKYIGRIELTDKAVEGYWVAAGYAYSGEVPASRLRPGKW
jgi:hypothetical protein